MLLGENNSSVFRSTHHEGSIRVLVIYDALTQISPSV
jgi:hypothetical protein